MNEQAMEQRMLGPDRPVGSVGLGCMSFAGFYGATTRDESLATLARAAELGVTHLDTAIIYGDGLSESIIGEYTASHPDHRFVIASKCGIVVDADGRRFDNSRDYVRSALEGSLERLRTDYLDVYYLHRRDPSIPVEEAITYMAELVDEGLIGGIGLSEIAPFTLERATAVHPIAAVQNEYSLWVRLPELGLLQTCARLGTAFVAFSSVGRGAFADVALDPANFGERDFRRSNPRFSPENFAVNNARIDGLRAFAAERGVPTATIANAWPLAQGPHIITIPGTRTPGHLNELAASAELTLTEADLAEIERLLPVGWAYGSHRNPAQMAGSELYC